MVQNPKQSFWWNCQKLWRNKTFMSLTSIFGYNFTQNLRNIEFSQAKRLSYILELFCWHILARFRKNPRNGFSAKYQKLLKMAKNVVFRTNERFSRKRAKISKKRPCYASYIFYPQLRAKFRKNPWSGFWDNPWRTDGHTILILKVPLGFQSGTKKRDLNRTLRTMAPILLEYLLSSIFVGKSGAVSFVSLIFMPFNAY